MTHFKVQLGGELHTALVVSRATLRGRSGDSARAAARRVRDRVRPQ